MGTGNKLEEVAERVLKVSLKPVEGHATISIEDLKQALEWGLSRRSVFAVGTIHDEDAKVTTRSRSSRSGSGKCADARLAMSTGRFRQCSRLWRASICGVLPRLPLSVDIEFDSWPPPGATHDINPAV
jgi:hypothetical protein